mgnify:CR=1 FL=1
MKHAKELEIVTFAQLKFEPHRMGTGVHATYFTGNGYGVSVIQTPFSYGGPLGQYEVAVVKGDHNEWHLNYDTPVTSDVIGWCDPDRVVEIIAQVAALQPTT